MLPSIFGENLFDEMFDFDPFDDFFTLTPARRRHHGHDPLFGKNAKHLMRTDVKEKKDCYELDVDLPGFKKEDVQATVENGYLTISAEKGMDRDDQEKDGRYIRKERVSGKCARSFYVGDSVQEGDIKAKFSDGILRLTIPKKEIEQLPEHHGIDIE